MAPPGKTGGRPRTATAIVADTQVGYDPHSMMWTTVPSSDSRPELPQPFKSAALAAAVARGEQASNALTAASANAASPDAAADAKARTYSQRSRRLRRAPRARSRGRSGLCGNLNPYRSRKQDLVVVLKPWTQLSLATVFPENGAGRALIAHLGATATRLVTVVMVREQNLILTYTSNPQIADKLIGEFAVPSLVGPVPLFGYLRADTQDCCYGVVTVRSSDTKATLLESLYWPEGEILHVRRLGTSNKVRLTFSGKVKPWYVSYDALLIPVQPYRKTVPACGRCGSVGHRPDACPGPKPDLCGISEKRCRSRIAPAPLTSVRPGALQDAATQIAHSSTGGEAGPKKRKRRRPRKPRKTGRRASPQRAQPPATNPTPPPQSDTGAIDPSLRGQTPDGPPTRKSTTRQVSPTSPKPHPPSPEPKPTAQGDLSWASRVRQGPLVSASDGAASPPPLSMIPHPKPPTPSTPSREQIGIRQLQAQVASLTQAVEELVNRLTSANPTPSGQAPEAMDSVPSEHRDTTVLLAPIEVRVSSLEAHVASIVTTIEDRLAAALQTVVDRILGMIAAQLPQHAFSALRPKLKRISKSRAPRPTPPPPKVAAVDRQSKVSIATSDVSTGSSSGAPMDLSALLEAPQISSSHDGGQRL
ncbi:hypothetical protein HPB49_012251 [Dermacentor silvarum]|uniref:Uncharacterized protein n=1 Tax=Dermacentor silvarum TaxID=543639 RepID=A0ACB8CRC0_DERSI|nr:hypothetical protein HPB49_012251 [Dermacentor silvarum]